jgi:hypothetical protein
LSDKLSDTNQNAEGLKMKRWAQWTLITVTFLPFACGLIYHAHDRLNRSPIRKETSVVLEAGPMYSAITSRMAAKRQVANEVIAGRLSLLYAAAAFRHLDERWPHTAMPSIFFPNAASDDEVYCLLVIAYVRAEAPPERAADLGDGLQAELAAMLRDGKLHLPDVRDATTAVQTMPKIPKIGTITVPPRMTNRQPAIIPTTEAAFPGFTPTRYDMSRLHC